MSPDLGLRGPDEAHFISAVESQSTEGLSCHGTQKAEEREQLVEFHC